MNDFFTSISQTPLFYPPFKKRNHGQYYLYQPHRYVTSAPAPAEPATGPAGTQINDLYPEILAIVFSYLPLQDKGRACQVCRKWYNTIYQYKSLWKNIEAKIHLSNIHYSNKIVMKNIIKSIVKRNITRIQILSTNNNNINLLFKNNYMIRSLNLSGLFNLNDNIILNLIIVNLNLNKFNHLTHLNLSVCKLLTDHSLMYICKCMNRLTDLNVSGCNALTNNSLLFIYKYLSELKHLNLKSLWLINDVGISYLCGVGVDTEDPDDFVLPKRPKGSSHQLNELINRIDARSSESQESSEVTQSSSTDNISCKSESPVKTLPRTYLTGHLETLILQDCQRITDESIKVIAASMTSLRHLNLSFCINVSDNCFKYINKMPQLSELILRSCNITDTGIEYLNSNLDNLSTLDLCFCESITDRTLQHLCVYILNLRHLYLSHCLITDVGLSRISKTMFNLESLYLGQCHCITDASIINFIQSSSDVSSSSESRSNSNVLRVDSRFQTDPERRLKYLDVYGCKLINYNVLLAALSQSNSNIVINFGLS